MLPPATSPFTAPPLAAASCGALSECAGAAPVHLPRPWRPAVQCSTQCRQRGPRGCVPCMHASWVGPQQAAWLNEPLVSVCTFDQQGWDGKHTWHGPLRLAHLPTHPPMPGQHGRHSSAQPCCMGLAAAMLSVLRAHTHWLVRCPWVVLRQLQVGDHHVGTAVKDADQAKQSSNGSYIRSPAS